MVWACVRKGFQVRVEAGGCILPPTIRIRLVMPHSPEEKKKVLTRIRRIRGQCEGLERALEAGADCGPVLQQIAAIRGAVNGLMRSEEHTSELQSLMRISYAVFCLKKKIT